jgi:hypothetical protein
MYSDQNGRKYEATWRLVHVCLAGWVYWDEAESICRESSARASRSQSCCLQAVSIDWLPHDSARVARSSMIVFTLPHRTAIVRVVGGSEDAKVSQASTQSLRSANIKFGRHRKGSRRRRSSYGRSAERPAAARATPLLDHRHRSLGRRSKRIWCPKAATGRPCASSRGLRGTYGVRANALKTAGCTDARSWAGHTAWSATMGKQSWVRRRRRNSRRKAGFWCGFLRMA